MTYPQRSSLPLKMIFQNGAMLTVQLGHRPRSPVSQDLKQGACQELVVRLAEEPLKTLRLVSRLLRTIEIFLFFNDFALLTSG